ncbi:MAG: isoleucine--tRNA ligase, partial [Spirochaetaceae bacterium]|nr:isoleucine--tRNA ligase [Spirochaetaceae bacterium]
MWLNLRTEDDPESVHLADYPVYNEAHRDLELEFKMDTVQKAVSMGRSLRYQYNLKIRQPLKSVEFVTRNPDEKRVLLEMEESIREELNVKKVVFHQREDELVEYKAKANFRTLGKELGPLMKAASTIIAELEQDAIQSILEGSTLSIDVQGTTVELDATKIMVDRIEKANLKVVNEGTLTVALDSEITDELKKEGYVRDLIRGIQSLRKESGLAVTDRINLKVSCGENSADTQELKDAFSQFGDFIRGETLAEKLDWEEVLPSGTQVEAGDAVWSVALEKA